MNWQYTPYLLPLVITAAISATIAFLAWRRRPAPGAMPLVYLMLAVCEWSLGYAVGMASADLPAKVFWAKVQYFGIVSVPIMWLFLVLQYTHLERWLTRRNRLLLAIMPLLTLLLAWTNESHSLIWSDIRLDTSGSFSVLYLSYGAFVWVWVIYSYSLILLGSVLLLQALVRSPHLYRGQTGALLIGALAPWVGNVLRISGLNPFPHLDLTNFAFTLSGLAAAWALFRFRLLDIVPVARDAVIESMDDGVIVLDAQNRIVDLNPGAGRIIGCSIAEAIGQPATQVLSDWPDLVERYHGVTEARAEIALGEGEAQRHYDLRLSPLYDRRGRLTGRLAVLCDIAEHKRAEEELREYRDHLERLVGERTAELTRINEQLGQEITERKRAEEELRQAYENSLRKQEAILNLTEDLKNEIAERKRVEGELQQRTAQLEALRQVGLEIAAELDLDPLLHSIVSQAVELVGGTAGGLYLYRPDLDVLGWVMAVGPHMPPLGTVLRRGEGFSGKVWEAGEPLMVDDYQQWEGRAPIYEDYPWTAVVGVPVHWGEKFLGVLNVLADAPHTFSLADAEMLSLFATQAAIAIRNACLFDGEQEQRELAEALEEAAAAVSSTLDLDEVLDRILEQTEQVVDGDAFSVILIEDDIARLARCRGYELPGEETLPSRFDIPINDYSILMKMVRMGESVVVADTSLDPDWVPAERDEGWRRSYVGVPIRLGGATAGFLGVSGTRPGQFGPKDVRMVEALASHAAAAIENARLHEDTQQKTEELELLLDTATAVSSTLEPDRVLRSVAEKMTTSVGVAFCRIALLDENSQTLTIRAAFAVHDLDWDPGLGRQYTLADAPWHRQAIERGQIMTLRQDDPSQAASETECRMALSEGIQSALLIPLVIGNRVLGVVSLGEMRSWGRLPFTADRVRLCQAMANQTAVAIRNAQLLNAGMEHRRDLQRLSTQLINAQEGERRRLSRELHDEMGQALTMMRISLVKIWEELPPQVTATLKRRLTEASSLAEQTLEQVRELSLDLRPTMLDDFGLVSALRWYLDRYAKRLDIEVAFEAIDLEDRLPAEMETALYRVAQEALTNVARHAQANKVHLRVERKEASVAALIEDDGRGFEVEKMGDSQAPERGIGLLGIRERVTSLGGNFDIQSGPGEGTRLTIEIPV